MLQITPQMRILVAVEAVDFRKYAPSMNMRSFLAGGLQDSSSASLRAIVAVYWAPHNVAF